MSAQLRDLHTSVLDLVALINRPQGDAALIAAAGISLEGALFPLLVLIERYGPIGVVDLADRVGRDYTTVSRQVARLEALGLCTRQLSARDRRIREALIAPAGSAMIERINAAREHTARAAFSDWDREEIDTLVRLMRRFVDDMAKTPATPPASD